MDKKDDAKKIAVEEMRQVMQRAADIGVDLSQADVRTLKSAMAFFLSLDTLTKERERVEKEMQKCTVNAVNICAQGLVSRSTVQENPLIKALLEVSKEAVRRKNDTVEISKREYESQQRELQTYKEWHQNALRIDKENYELREENRRLNDQIEKFRKMQLKRSKIGSVEDIGVPVTVNTKTTS